MHKKILLSILAAVISIVLTHAQTIRIACVGNSITYGSGIPEREKNAYPAQLQSLLGNHYEVMNFGVSGATLLTHGNKPYRQTDAYPKALASKPDIVCIKLGTNDSKLVNRKFYNEFISDYKALIQTFQSLPSKPRILLLAPVPSFLADSTSIYDPVIVRDIIPMIRQTAFETGCEIISLYPLFIDNPALLPDKIHPSKEGAAILAKRVAEAVRLTTDKPFDIFTRIKGSKTVRSFHGFECAEFTWNNRSCKVVKPKVLAKGSPWVWRARFWGHEPQTDIALLERGFHIVYCDASELFGNAEAIALWNDFYTYMRNGGLSKKVVLEGMSRGGVYAYNWALANPRKVACIYADAPVLDLKSWPGGKGTGKGSPSDWDIFKKDYNLTEEQAAVFSGSPLDNAARIAKLGFPILHVVGDADNVVPVSENTAPFETAIRNAGGNITVIHKPGIGHHPHSLPNPTPIVNFILAATGQTVSF